MSDETENVADVPAERDEVERLDPPSGDVVLSSGSALEIQALKARQFFRLLRIITRGGANVLGAFRLNANMSQDEFLANLLAIVVFAIPEAEEETIDFVKSMVLPKGYEALTDPKARQQSLELMHDELDNPELIDLIDIVTAIVRRESADLQGLGKRLKSLMALAEKTGQLPKTGTNS